MNVIKCKFSKFPDWDETYMKSQKEYTFLLEDDVLVNRIVYVRDYEKYIHITEQNKTNADTKFFEPDSGTLSNKKASDKFIPLAILTNTGNTVFGKYPIYRIKFKKDETKK